MQRDESRTDELLRCELLQREIDAFDVEPGADEPRRRRSQRERLAPQFIRIDEDDLEALRAGGGGRNREIAHGPNT